MKKGMTIEKARSEGIIIGISETLRKVKDFIELLDKDLNRLTLKETEGRLKNDENTL